MSALRILHLASFTGNIGDNANHMGFRPWFEARLGRAVAWTDLEIREFYWRERAWDDSFVAMANAHDLVVIGGGNYFELWVADSPTGTSIAIPPELFAQIRTPVFFNALGVDPGQGVPESSLARFRAFLDTLLADPRHLVSVRNDGAMGTLHTYLGAERADAVHRVPDGGFFAPVPDDRISLIEDGRRLVGVNIAGDMAETRFQHFAEAGTAGFAREMAATLSGFAAAHPDTDFILFPHIFRDLDIVAEVIGHLDDRLRRTRLTVAPYGSGNVAARAVLGLYAACDLVLAMRFHANVCPIGMGRQTLGLNCYPQIANLYAEIGQPDRAIEVSRPDFSGALMDAATRALEAPHTFSGTPQQARAQVAGLRSAFEPALDAWFARNDLAGAGAD